MEGNRVTPEAAASHARAQGWDATRFTYAAEADTGKRGGASQSEKRGGFGLARSLLGSLTGGAIGGSGDAVLDVADSAIGKSEEEILAEELALGPELAGSVLGAAPLWPAAEAPRRVKLDGRRVAAADGRGAGQGRGGRAG